MKALRHLLPVLLLGSAPAWTSPAAACQVGVASNSAAMPAHHQQHHMAGVSRQAPAPADPELDCAACVGVLPSLNDVAERELMPLVPVAETPPARRNSSTL